MGKSEGRDEASSDASPDTSPETSPDSPPSGLTSSAVKPRWRRLVEVAVPVAAFAIVVPFAVNGLASAVNSGESSASSTTSLVDEQSTTTAAAAEPTTTSTTVPAPTTIAVPVTVANAAPDADDKTISLASEIISEVPAGATATGAATGTADAGSVEETTTTVAAGHSHGGVHPEVALTREERKQLGLQLLQARNAAAEFPTVADALAGGYTMVTGYVPLIGAHYIKWSLMDGTFDVNQPEMLLYDGTDPTSSIVGLSYYVFSDTEPSPFVGQNDSWHQHIGLCIKDGVVVGGESTTVAECAARGGAKANVGNGWMVHAWVVPGWESPQGVFSPEHPGLTADLPTS